MSGFGVLRAHWHPEPGAGGLQGLQPGVAVQGHQSGGGPQGQGGPGGGDFVLTQCRRCRNRDDVTIDRRELARINQNYPGLARK